MTTKITQKLEKPIWVKMSETELKKIIAKLSEKHQPAKVGLILRDQYGIPTTKLYGKKLSVYLKELNLPTSKEVENAENKFTRIKEHLKSNITDKKAKHKLQKAQARLNIVKKYFAKKENSTKRVG